MVCCCRLRHYIALAAPTGEWNILHMTMTGRQHAQALCSGVASRLPGVASGSLDTPYLSILHAFVLAHQFTCRRNISGFLHRKTLKGTSYSPLHADFSAAHAVDAYANWIGSDVLLGLGYTSYCATAAICSIWLHAVHLFSTHREALQGVPYSPLQEVVTSHTALKPFLHLLHQVLHTPQG
jgi:hypothetical protein